VAKNWTYVRITRDTHAALCRVRESMRLAEEMHLVELETDDRDRVSLDQVIARLVAMRDQHAARRQRSASRRGRRKAGAQQQADTREDVGGVPPTPPDRSSSPFPDPE